MVIIVDETERVAIPEWVVDLESFRRWVDADDFPQTGRIAYLKGEVWVDMSREQLFSHSLVKTEISAVLRVLVKAAESGLFFNDGILVSNVHADIATNPDATFVSNHSLECGDVRLIEAKRGGYVEVEGSPDMVLEVISTSSVQKDTDILRQGYWEAGVKEYWLVDARKEPRKFEVLRHGAKGYTATRKQDGWVKSAVFGRAFRLTQRTTALGHPEFSLDVR